jgi:uncharacterized protein YkwD
MNLYVNLGHLNACKSIRGQPDGPSQDGQGGDEPRKEFSRVETKQLQSSNSLCFALTNQGRKCPGLRP